MTWNNNDTQFLIDNYSSKGADYCSIELNKSKTSVYSKAHKLGLNSFNRLRKTHEEYCDQLMSLDSIWVPMESYITKDTAIIHECDNGHMHSIKPNHVLNGSGCPMCLSSSGMQLDRPAILYFIKIGDYYKLGITGRTVKQRFSGEKKPIKILYQKAYITGRQAWFKEIELLDKYKAYKADIKNYLKSGNSELFNADLTKIAPQDFS